jgi:hypothetical protein
MSWRLLAGLSLLCALSGALAGCGGGRPSTSVQRPAPTHSSAVPGRNAARRLTKAEAAAFARAVNLTPADVPGAVVSQEKHGSKAGDDRVRLDRCERLLNHVQPHELVHRGSPPLTRGEELEREWIASYVAVVPDVRAAAREVARFGSRNARACIARALSVRFAKTFVHGARFGRFSASSLPVPAPGASATVGVRFSSALMIPVSEVSVPIYIDLLGFARGPAQVALVAASVTQPVPSSTEHQLLSVLVSRAESHPL